MSTAARSHLTPVIVTDKNGVQTTRWKRTEAAATTGRSIPPIKVHEARTQDQLIQEKLDLRRSVSTAFPFSVFHGDSFYDYDELGPKISKGEAIDRYLTLSQDTRKNIGVIGARDDATTTSAMILVKMLARNTDERMIDDVATYMAATDTMNFHFINMMFNPDSEVDVQYQPIQIDVSGLKYYRLNGFTYDPSLPINAHDEHTREQITAIFKLHSLGHALRDEYPYSERDKQPVKVTANNVVKPYWIAQYAVENVDKVDYLIATIRDRQSTNKEMLISVMENESAPLSEGVL